MADPDDVRPRRALPPQDSDGDGDAPDLGHADADDPRRRFWTPTGDAEPSLPDTGTPIPPPAVLPQPSDAPAGRRFSADDVPDDLDDADRPAPRRSAVSPTASRAQSPDAEADADDAPPPATASERRRPWLIAASALAVVAVIVALAVWTQGRGSLPSATPTPTVDPVATYLAQPEDLASLRDTTWSVVATLTEVDDTSPRAACLTPTTELEGAPEETMVRTFSPTTGAAAGALHQVDRFGTAEDAEAAYSVLLNELANCPAATAWAQAGHDVSGLGDEAAAVSYVVQNEVSEYHALLLSRTGTRVNIVDVTDADGPTAMQGVADVLATVATRQCADDGTCPDAQTVTDGVPPVADPPGWLADVDLPRITPGAGVWRGTDIPTMRLAGTRCEAVDLNAVAAVSGAQRTYLLADDAAAPGGFGVDEAVWTFGTIDEATAFANTLWTNIDGCPGRTGTATVERTGDVNGVGSGVLWTITQPLDENETTARFRVAVIARDQRVVYLMANPSTAFDFTNETWLAVATRAGQRLVQLP